MYAHGLRIWQASKDFLESILRNPRRCCRHGQMPPTVLDDIMSAFFDGNCDVLLSTTITINPGLDVATANTLIVHPRADRFGLSQLYGCVAGWDARSCAPMRC